MDELEKLISVVAFMAVLSQATQKVTDLCKARSAWLNNEQASQAEEGKRQFWIFLIAFGFGAFFSAVSGFTPHLFLGSSGSQGTGSLLAGGFSAQALWASPIVGLAVAFGGNIWNELLGILREVKKGKESAVATIPMTVSSVSPDTGKPGDEITIAGGDFGTIKGNVTFDGAPAKVVITSWTQTGVKFRVPAKRGMTEEWPASTLVDVGVKVGDRESIDTKPLKVQKQ